jgi:hypothetical protein
LHKEIKKAIRIKSFRKRIVRPVHDHLMTLSYYPPDTKHFKDFQPQGVRTKLHEINV